MCTTDLSLISVHGQSVPKPPPVPPSKKRKRVMEEPPELLAPKPLLSGAIPLEAFLAALHKVSLVKALTAGSTAGFPILLIHSPNLCTYY